MNVKSSLVACLIGTLIVSSLVAQNRQQRRGQRNVRDDGGLKVGQLAPTFELKSLDGKESFDLKSLRGNKPVLLFFGSYT